jgi:spermidine dehydrogenase
VGFTDAKGQGVDEPGGFPRARGAFTRRDFIHGSVRLVGGAVAGSVAGWPGTVAAGAMDPPARASAAPAPEPTRATDPPLRTGLRGFDDAAMSAGHAVRDGLATGEAQDTGETYDLVVVGAGMAGLSAAYYFRQQVPGAKVLVLEGCDDLGGHARRVEFDVDGHRLLVCGGTQELWNLDTFPPEALRMLADLGIDRERYLAQVATETDPLEARGLGSAGFFAREHYGEDRLVPGRPLLRRSDAATLRAWFDLTPMPEALKAGLVRLYTDRGDTMPGLPVAEKIARLRAMSYLDYLREHLRLPREALDYVLMGGSGDGDNTSAGPDTFSAWYAWRRNRPGLDGLGLPSTPRLSHPAPEPGPHVAFPDGNAGVARLLARALVPGSLPGSSAEDSIGSRLQYERLDLPGNDVRIRLSSTVVRVAHRGQAQAAEGVEAVYLQDGRLRRVRAAVAIMAGFNAMVPHLVPELPEPQKAALRMAVRKPLVRAFAALRNWRAFERLGVYDIDCPGMFYRSVYPWIRPEWGGAYRNARTPDEPVVVYLNLSNHVLEQHGSPMPPRERWRAGRAQLLGLGIDTMEGHVRDQLQRLLGPGGFDAGRDLAGITVCRWAHGYAGGTNELYDPDWAGRTDAPWVVGRQRFGRIAISNSDAAATSLTSAAFAQSHRAVTELVNDVIRPVYDFRWSERDTSVQP